MFIFCDTLRLEPQCSLSWHRITVCSRCFRAGRSCLLPVVCRHQGRTVTGAEGLNCLAFCSGQRSPRNRLVLKFPKSSPKHVPLFVPKFARKCWAFFYTEFPSQFLSPLRLGINSTPLSNRGTTISGNNSFIRFKFLPLFLD